MEKSKYSRRLFLKYFTVFSLSQVGCKTVEITEPNHEIITFAQISDTHVGYKKHTAQNLPRIVEQINQCFPDVVIHTGDVAHFDVIPEWAVFHRNMRETVAEIQFVPGNHDVGKLPTKESLQKWQDHMGMNRFCIVRKMVAFIGVDLTSFWRLDWKDTEGQIRRQEEEIQSLEQMLEKTKECKARLVFSHFPLYLTNIEESDYSNVIAQSKLRKQLLRVLADGNCDAYFCGHTHFGWQNELVFHNKRILQTSAPSLSYPAMIPQAQNSQNLRDSGLLGWNLWKFSPEIGLLEREFITLNQEEKTVFFSQ